MNASVQKIDLCLRTQGPYRALFKTSALRNLCLHTKFLLFMTVLWTLRFGRPNKFSSEYAFKFYDPCKRFQCIVLWLFVAGFLRCTITGLGKS